MREPGRRTAGRRRKERILGAAMVCGLALAIGAPWLKAGTLAPPGPPAPTMKTLDEVMPGVPIKATDFPLTISTPGHYYLAEDINALSGGITIESNDVTIDLMGFALSGGPGDGIRADFSLRRVTVRNGRITGWSSCGIELSTVTNAVVSGVTSGGNGSCGINVGAAGFVSDSSAELNAGPGIIVSDGRVSNSRAYANTARGFSLGTNVVMTGSMALANTGSGIFADSGCSITDSVSSNNGYRGIESIGEIVVSRCIVRQNAEVGIAVGSGGSIIESCSVSGNGGFNEIWVPGIGATVRGCDIVSSGGVGIYVTGGRARIEGNHIGGLSGTSVGILVNSAGGSVIDSNTVTGHDLGIAVDSTSSGNVIVRNKSISNIAAYTISPGNDLGPVGTAAASTSPWANVVF